MANKYSPEVLELLGNIRGFDDRDHRSCGRESITIQFRDTYIRVRSNSSSVLEIIGQRYELTQDAKGEPLGVIDFCMEVDGLPCKAILNTQNGMIFFDWSDEGSTHLYFARKNCNKDLVVAGSWSQPINCQYTQDFPPEQVSEILFSKLDEEIFRSIAREHHQLIFLHSASVTKGDRCLHFLGPSRSGKSTLAHAFALKGWMMLNDDITPVDAENRQVLRFPRKPNLRSSGSKLIEKEVGEFNTNKLNTLSESPVQQSMLLHLNGFSTTARIKRSKAMSLMENLISNIAFIPDGEASSTNEMLFSLVSTSTMYELDLAESNLRNTIGTIEHIL